MLSLINKGIKDLGFVAPNRATFQSSRFFSVPRQIISVERLLLSQNVFASTTSNFALIRGFASKSKKEAPKAPQKPTKIAEKTKEKETQKTKDKEQEKEDKDKTQKEKEKEKAQKEKERAQKEKEKEREKTQKEKEKERALKEKEKEKALREKEKEKEKKEKERAKLKEQKEKEKSLKEKERERDRLQKEKEKERLEKEKAKELKEKAKEEALAKPKRARNAYTFYYQDNYKKFHDANPKAAIPQIAKIMSQKWAGLSDAQKQPYIAKAKADRERNRKDKEEYLKTLGPKKPLTPFLLYSQEVRESIRNSNPNVGITEISKIIGEKWKSLPENHKQKYRDSSEQALAKWKAEKEKHAQHNA